MAPIGGITLSRCPRRPAGRDAGLVSPQRLELLPLDLAANLNIQPDRAAITVAGSSAWA